MLNCSPRAFAVGSRLRRSPFFNFHTGCWGETFFPNGKQLFSRFLSFSFFIQDSFPVSLTPQDSLKINMRSSSLASAAITAGLLSIIPASRAFPAIKRQLVSDNAEASSVDRGGQLTITSYCGRTQLLRDALKSAWLLKS